MAGERTYTNPFPLDERDGKDTFTHGEIRESLMRLIRSDIEEQPVGEFLSDAAKTWGSILANRGAQLTPEFLARIDVYQARLKAILDDIENEETRDDLTTPLPVPLPDVPDPFRSDS
jgi:hypothetical protein